MLGSETSYTIPAQYRPLQHFAMARLSRHQALPRLGWNLKHLQHLANILQTVRLNFENFTRKLFQLTFPTK
ncbi:MAG: hypothetical protein ABID35_04965 [Candidatus Margulisiibacteriota bacterium]